MGGFRSTTPRSVDRRSGRAGSEFTALAKTIRDRGLLRRRYGYYWSKLIGLPLVLAGGLLVFARGGVKITNPRRRSNTTK